MRSDGEVFLVLVAHLVLTGLPAVAAALFAVRRGVTEVPLVLGIALAASGLTAFAAFWAFFIGPTAGQTWDFLILLGSVQLGVWSVYRADLDPLLLRRLRTPLLLWALGSLFIAYFGFLHGGVDQAISTPATRFSSPLPSDNDIPRFFADWFAAHGHRGTPPVYPPNWLMSDRPPLQVGYVLSQHAILPTTRGLSYQVLGVVIQQLWIVALWALLCAARLRPFTRGLAMLAAFVSDVAIVHGFYVWPKLIAAAFVLAAAAIVISPRRPQLRRDPRVALLLGTLLALAMLSHGASVYGVIPLVLIGWRRWRPDWRFIGIAALAGAVLVGSWTAYQRLDDPPGNRLLKWHLAGQTVQDDRSAIGTIVDAYGDAGITGTLENKWNNVAEMTGITGIDNLGKAAEAAEAGHLGAAVAEIRAYRFFELLPFLGLYLIAPFAMFLARARGRRDAIDWSFATFCFAFAVIGCAVWGLLQWGEPGGSTTMLHAGTLAIPLAALSGCVVGLRATYPRLAVGVVAANAIAVLVMYAPSLDPPPGTAYSPISAVLAVAALVGFGAVALGVLSERPTPATRRVDPRGRPTPVGGLHEPGNRRG